MRYDHAADLVRGAVVRNAMHKKFVCGRLITGPSFLIPLVCLEAFEVARQLAHPQLSIQLLLPPFNGFVWAGHEQLRGNVQSDTSILYRIMNSAYFHSKNLLTDVPSSSQRLGRIFHQVEVGRVDDVEVLELKSLQVVVQPVSDDDSILRAYLQQYCLRMS